ncbi:MAG: pyridoxal phosphate-dependent aminotransferase [Bacteroidia bacterium]|nr:pyridoxal phosphate-dependent aminotransferase [Bacteroidia bacterium]
MQLSSRIASVAPSATLSISKKVRELKAEGRDVIGLTLGEPDFDTPEHIREAAKAALDAGYTHYPPVAGYPELRQAIVDKLKRDNGLSYAPNQIVVSTGAKQSLYNVVLGMLNPGDGVILPTPYWVSYEAMCILAQADITRIPTSIDTAYKISPEQLETAIKPNTRLLFLTTPSNPSGSMYSEAELAELVKVLERHPEVYIISDEIYEHITFGFDHVSLGSFESIFDRVITVNGFSKGYAMTGWRLGYIAAPLEIAKVSEKLQGQCTSGPNAFAQQGAIAALNGDLSPTYAMREAFRKRRDMMYDELRAIEGLEVILPDGAFYFYPDLKAFLGKTSPAGKKLDDIGELCLYLIDEVGLALVPGNAFGTASHARISYAYADEVLKDAVNRLKTGLSKLS